MKQFRGYLFSLFGVVSIALLGFSCKPNIEYATEHGFSLRHDDYRQEVKSGKTYEIKLYLKEKSDLRDNVYRVNYFSRSGEGAAYIGPDSKRLENNTPIIFDYELDNFSGEKLVRFYYTPHTEGRHEMTLTVSDLFGNMEHLAFKFEVK